jgi:hypothetical protein
MSTYSTFQSPELTPERIVSLQMKLRERCEAKGNRNTSYYKPFLTRPGIKILGTPKSIQIKVRENLHCILLDMDKETTKSCRKVIAYLHEMDEFDIGPIGSYLGEIIISISNVGIEGLEIEISQKEPESVDEAHAEIDQDTEIDQDPELIRAEFENRLIEFLTTVEAVI